MNPLERLFYTAKYKVKSLPLYVKILPLALIVLAIVISAIVKTGVFDTVGMTPEQKAEYIQEKEQKELDEEKAEKEQTRIQSEAENGFKLFDSPNLTDEEKLGVEFVHACNEKDYEKLAKVLNVPNFFTADNIDQWENTIGVVPYLGTEDDSKIAVTVIDDNVYEDGSDTKIVSTKRVCQIFTQETMDNRYEIEVVQDGNKMFLTPDEGIVEDVAYKFQSKNISCNGNDLSGYCTESVKSPINVGTETKTETQELWYVFTFERMAKLDSVNFEMKTDIDSYETISASMSGNGNAAMAMIGNFTDEQIDSVNEAVKNVLWDAITAIKEGQPSEKIANYIAVSDVINSIPVIDEDSEEENAKVDEKNILKNVASVRDVEVSMNTSVNGDIPSTYNYHVAGDSSISARINVRFVLDSGECRRTTTVLIRKYDTHWTIVAMNDNLFEKLNVLDPEW